MRPQLKYVNVVWAPHRQNYVDLLERVQKRATENDSLFLGSAIHGQAQASKALSSVAYRRKRGGVIQVIYKIAHGIDNPTLRTPWSNCYGTATESELSWLGRNVTGGGCFSNRYESGQSQTLCTKLLAHWQWRGRSRCGLDLLRNTQSFCSRPAHTPAYRVCWGIQLLVPPLGNLSTLKFLTFRTSFSVFHCLPALSISALGKS